MTQLLVVITALLIGWMICAIIMKREQRAFEARFPPLSDGEFVARCAPGTNTEVALKVRRIVAENLGVEYRRIYPSTRFIEDLGAD